MENAYPKVIRIDSRFRSSGTATDWTTTLPYPVQLPDGVRCFVTGLSCPHSFYNVQEGVSDKFHVVETRTVGGTPQKRCRVLTLDAGNYTSAVLANTLQTLLNTNSLLVGMAYTVTYSTSTGTIRIVLNTAAGGTADPTARFQIPGLEEISSRNWYAANWTGNADAYSPDDPDSIAEFLRLAPVSAPTVSYNTGLLNVSPTAELYLHSNLGVGDSIGPRGQADIIQRVPVTTTYGYQLIYLPTGSDQEHFDVSRTTLQALSFRLANVYGRTVDLQGGTVSLELTFSTPQ